MEMQRILGRLDELSLDELRQLQAHVSDLIARLEAQQGQTTPTEAPASYQAYKDMKEHAPEDLGEK